MLNYHPDNALEYPDLVTLEMTVGKWDAKTQEWMPRHIQNAPRNVCQECGLSDLDWEE